MRRLLDAYRRSWFAKLNLPDKLGVCYGYFIVIVGGSFWIWLAYRGLTRHD